MCSAIAGTRPQAFLYAFDLLELNGTDLRQEPIEVRKATLASVLRKSRPGLRLNEHLEHSEGVVVFQHACALGCEGIVSKRLGSRYRSGRSPDWLKFKNPQAPAVRRRRTGPNYDKARRRISLPVYALLLNNECRGTVCRYVTALIRKTLADNEKGLQLMQYANAAATTATDYTILFRCPDLWISCAEPRRMVSGESVISQLSEPNPHFNDV